MAVPAIDSNVPVDGSDRLTPGFMGTEDGSSDEAGGSTELKFPDDEDINGESIFRLSQQAESQGTTFFQTGVRTSWSRNYRAYRSQHSDGSKYLDPRYAGRSKLFRPKTRDAVRKKMMATASALFSTGDVVTITAANEADDMQQASASIKKELLNYRLSRETKRNGIRWNLIALGGIQTAQITGVTISKQSWLYQEEKLPEKDEPEYPPEDALTGQPQATKAKGPNVVVDRPDINLYPPENVIFDPNCDWTNPAQSSQYIRLATAMSPDDAWLMASQSQGVSKKIPFLDIGLETFRSACASTTGPMDTVASRVARNDGRDPIMMVNGAFGRVWIYEWFMRIRGKDYTYFTLGTQKMLSEPVLVRDAYPEQGGDRPIVIGYGAIEAFRPYPTSPVESWSNLQIELNEQVNLRIDHLRRTVSPAQKVKRGAQVDMNAVQKLGANRVVMLNNMDDLMPVEMPDIPASAQNQDAQLNADFDSLSGTMNMGTVQTNRQLNETVGGMNLLSGDATAMSDFDLSCWVDSYVAPVMQQLLKLEEYYESDETVLAICGEKAKLFQRFGISEITDHLLMAETTLSVKAGVGSANQPMQKLQKFQMASQTVGQILQPYVAAGIIKPPLPNVKEIIETVFGAAGFTDGGDRFFMGLDENMQGQQPADPRQQAAAMQADVQKQKLMVDAQKSQQDAQLKMAELQQRAQEFQGKQALGTAQLKAKLLDTHMRTQAELAKNKIGNAHARGMQAEDHAHQMRQGQIDREHQMQQQRHSALENMFMAATKGIGGANAGPVAQSQTPPSSQPQPQIQPGT